MRLSLETDSVSSHRCCEHVNCDCHFLILTVFKATFKSYFDAKFGYKCGITNVNVTVVVVPLF